MIRELYCEFLTTHGMKLGPTDLQKLTTLLAGYISRVTKSSRLMKTAKDLDIEDPFRAFRRRLDGNPYASSRMWRAVWAVMSGGSFRKTMKRYAVDGDDVEWIISNLSRKQLQLVEENAAEPWLKQPDYPEIEKQLLSMQSFCQRFAARKMSFLAKYDPSLTLADLENDMMSAGFSAAYRSDHRTDNMVYLRNIAWRSAKNAAQSIIKHHTTKGRSRIKRTQQIVQMETTVKIYTRTHCWKCREPSEDALCSTCSVSIAASETKMAKWNGRRESAQAFMSRANSISKDVQAGPHTCDQFMTTTAFLDAPIKNASNSGEQDTTLLDMIADKTADTLYVSPDTTDLVHDLCDQPIAVQRICAVILGGKDPEFDAWLVERHGDQAERLREKKLAAEACEFYGFSRRKLRMAMAPVLGVDLHA